MRTALLAILVIASSACLSGRSSAETILTYDFNAPNDRQGWTVSALTGDGSFPFENLDQLKWTATGGVGGTGGLWFHEQPTWNWGEVFTAPDELVAAVGESSQAFLSYDLTSNGDGGQHRLYLRGPSGGYISTVGGPESTAYGSYNEFSYNIRSHDLEWFHHHGGIAGRSEVLDILDNLTGLYIKADPSDSQNSWRTNHSILDNVLFRGAAAVPEPSSLTILATGLLGGITLWVRRRMPRQ